MSSRISGNSLYALAASGLTSNYYYLMQGVDGNGLTLENIINPSDEAKSSSYINYSFASYLANNFSSIDMDGDGVISSTDLSNYTTQMYSSGLTYNQLAQLCSQSSNSLLETVLNNFTEIDANGDGRVTSAEISAYGIEQEKEEMEEKYPKYDLKGMSIMYDTSSVTSSYESSSSTES